MKVCNIFTGNFMKTKVSIILSLRNVSGKNIQNQRILRSNYKSLFFLLDSHCFNYKKILFGEFYLF